MGIKRWYNFLRQHHGMKKKRLRKLIRVTLTEGRISGPFFKKGFSKAEYIFALESLHLFMHPYLPKHKFYAKIRRRYDVGIRKKKKM